MNSKQIGLIYIATHIDSGKMYVGQTSIKFERRIYEHLRQRNRTYFSSSLRKYGIEQFDFQLIAYPVDDLSVMESKLILDLNSKVPNGFNLTDGGDGTRGCHPSEEIRQKNRMAHLGKKLTEEHRKKIGQAGIGRKMSDKNRKILLAFNIGNHLSSETRAKMSASKTGKYNGNKNPFWGRHHSDETKKKISITNTGHVMSEESRRKMSASHKARLILIRKNKENNHENEGSHIN